MMNKRILNELTIGITFYYISVKKDICVWVKGNTGITVFILNL